MIYKIRTTAVGLTVLSSYIVLISWAFGWSEVFILFSKIQATLMAAIVFEMLLTTLIKQKS